MMYRTSILTLTLELGQSMPQILSTFYLKHFPRLCLRSVCHSQPQHPLSQLLACVTALAWNWIKQTESFQHILCAGESGRPVDTFSAFLIIHHGIHYCLTTCCHLVASTLNSLQQYYSSKLSAQTDHFKRERQRLPHSHL